VSSILGVAHDGTVIRNALRRLAETIVPIP